MITSVKRYIPTLVYDEIQKLHYKNKEHLYIITDMITRVSIYRKEDKDYSNQYTDIPSYYFTDIITKHKSYDDAIVLLKQNNIIESDNIYSKIGGKALGWRFTDTLISKLISVNLKSKPLSKNIISNRNSRHSFVNEKYSKYKQHFMSSFAIHYDDALKYINDWFDEQISSLSNSSLCSDIYNKEWIKRVNKYNSLFISITAINDGELFFRKNPTNGRIDTNLTNLKSELKRFIYKKDLRQVDIVNSQPFILSLLLSKSLLCTDFLIKSELERYVLWTKKGVFYENFEKEYFKKTSKEISRKKIKEIMFCIFYSKNNSYSKEKNIFKSIFPSIYKWIEEEKKDKHNQFAIKMQKIESDICIDCICKELDDLNIKYYTIHDAWLVEDKDVKKTMSIVAKCFQNSYMSNPMLKIEKIN
jgi:hypothetical protein